VIRYTEREKEKTVSQIIPVAGTYAGHSLDEKTTLLHPASSDNVDGVIIELHGKVYQDQRQSAIIELTCDKTVEVYPLHRRIANGRLANLVSGHSMKEFYDWIGEQNMPVQHLSKIHPLRKTKIQTMINQTPNIGVS
jgi:Autophagy-related protein 27